MSYEIKWHVFRLSILFLEKKIFWIYWNTERLHVQRISYMWDNQILCCITGTRWHQTPPQATWIQRKDVDALCTQFQLLSKIGFFLWKPHWPFSVALLLIKDTAFSYCFVWTRLGTFQLLPAVPVRWWSCLWTCKVFLLIAACSPLTWRPGTGTRLPAAANTSFLWPSRLKICPNN